MFAKFFNDPIFLPSKNIKKNTNQKTLVNFLKTKQCTKTVPLYFTWYFWYEYTFDWNATFGCLGQSAVKVICYG